MELPFHTKSKFAGLDSIH